MPVADADERGDVLVQLAHVVADSLHDVLPAAPCRLQDLGDIAKRPIELLLRIRGIAAGL